MKLTTAQRYKRIYDSSSFFITRLEKGIQESKQYRQELKQKEDETGRRCSDAESQQVKLNSAWDEAAAEQIEFLKGIVQNRPANLITLIRERMKYLKRERRELEREEPDGPWGGAYNAGRQQALQEQYDNLNNALDCFSTI